MEAWKVLSANGRARMPWSWVQVPEGDPKETSVGLGGLPDRDGRVTLDACIMDEHSNCGAVACLNILFIQFRGQKGDGKTPHVLLVGEGAPPVCPAQGFKREKLLTAESEKAWKEWLKQAEYKTDRQHREP